MTNWRKLLSYTFVAGVFSVLSVTNTYAKTTAITIENNVDVWNRADSSEEIVTTLDKEDKVEVLGTEGECFVVILDDGTEGYILKDLLNISSMDGVSTGDRVNIRKKPSTSSKVLGQVNRGDALIITGKSGDWYEIKYDGGKAWIHGNYVKASDEALFKNTKTSSNESNGSNDEVVEYAKRFIGTPYRYGGTDLSSGVDCSGFTQSVMRRFGVSLSRPSGAQAGDGVAISKSDLKSGDLVFFDTSGSNNGGISHVGIYIGNNQFIHAESSRGVSIDSLNEGYYIRTYVKAVRVM